jgi:hypothetical protein
MGAGPGLRRALPATAAVVALALAGSCSAADDRPRSQPSPGQDSTSPVGDGTSADPAVDTGHAMDPPGPREGVVAPPDIIVTSADSISADTVDAVRRMKGVDSVELISMTQVPIENRAVTVVAVNAKTYRNYTPIQTSEAQEVWDRVAGGELALRPDLKKKLPLDKDGYLKLGSTADAGKVHIGAFAPQVVEVDAVVNTSWIDSLGMTPDNALLIRTGRNAPIKLRKPIEKLLAGGASVQMVDAVARTGIDPGAKQVAVVTGTVADAVGIYRYSVLGGGHIAPDPAWVRTHIATDAIPILGTVTCNKLLFPQLKAALQEVVDRGLADKIHPGEYAGCYYPRFIAGSTTLSNHAFGLALDLNVPGNQRGTAGEMDRTVVSIFESWGFTWGGRWGYTDPMHFEMSKLVDPTLVSSRQ